MRARDALARLLDRPAGVAAAFAPLALAIWALQTGALGSDPGTRRTGLEVVQLVMLTGGLALYWFARRRDPAPPHRARGVRAWLAALVVAVAAHVLAADAHVLAADARPNAALTPALALAAFANMTLVAGLAEETWFRGLWMRAARPSAAVAIGLGALAFGLLHWPLGFGRVATTAALGALYGAARWLGAPLWSLALAHGAVNTISAAALPAASWRFDPLLSQGLFCALALVAAGAILTLTRPDNEPTRR